MKRIYVATLRRDINERGKRGHIYILDYEARAVIARRPAFSLRGLCFHDNALRVAGFKNTLSTVNLSTGALENTTVYDQLSGLHLLYSRGGCLWLTSTGNDSIVKVSNGGIVETIPLTKTGTNTLHFNSIAWAPAGDEYHLYNARGEIVNFTRKRTEVTGILHGHDLHFLDANRVIVNESIRRRALVVSIDSGEKSVIYTAPAEGPDTSENIWGFTRGVAASTDLVFLGSSPLHLRTFDRDLRLVDLWKVVNTPEETIFDICLDPRDWEIAA